MTPGPAPRAPHGLGTGNDQTRRHNLSAVLTTLHHDGDHTRAHLTRRLGLNRSTISALVGELVDLGLAYETAATAHAGVGRPSPHVHPDPSVGVIAVNPDTDAVTIGLVGLGGTVHRRMRVETATVPTVAETVALVERVIADWTATAIATTPVRIVGVGVAVPGLVRTESGVVTMAPHLGWRDAPVAAPLGAALGLPVAVTNDAHAGAIAESLYGAARGVRDLVYLNGSSGGIGGGVLVGGLPLRGARGFGAELGHTRAPGATIVCHCGRTGCLETEVSLDRLLAVLGRTSIDLDELDAALTGHATDPSVRHEVERQLDVLSSVLSDYVSVFEPERIVLGGFLGSLIAGGADTLLDRVRAGAFAPLADDLTITRAQLRSRLLLVGAAELAFAPLLADPAGVAKSGPTLQVPSTNSDPGPANSDSAVWASDTSPSSAR
ncbi:ROK family transcriptional regulator [Herbiconiux moechotypicola]|uniref:ROK family transcriptional regulator n=1 Tax=Herbiconiux moechotypicola TaxID=637393 RepID=A0ABP5QJV2_9MICO|nr:ROK family transcriptional regulator [Herbiconiux moechotypicola]MCS5730078.1 ROK family transcriptional regulator [Herbiconiux moechotypicola]